MFRILSRCLMAALAALLPLFSQAQAALDSVPFELGPDHRVYVRLHLGNGGGPSLRFLVDTGATDMVINTKAARPAGLLTFDRPVINRGPNSSDTILATGPEVTVRLGRLVEKQLTVLALACPPEAWDGVLGLSFLRRYAVRFDYGRRLLFFYAKGACPVPQGATVLPMRYRLGVPVVPASVTFCGRRRDVWLEIDTGSDRVLDLNTPFVEREGWRGLQTPFAISEIAGTAAQTGRLENVFFDEVRWADLSLRRIPGALSTVTVGVQASREMDGVMGNNLLQRFDQTYDFVHNKLYLVPNDRLYRPFYDFLGQ